MEVAGLMRASQRPTVVAAVAVLSAAVNSERDLKEVMVLPMVQMEMEDITAAVVAVVWAAQHLHPLV